MARPDQFATWRRLLADPHLLGKEILINEDDPMPGYWRAKNQRGLWIPVVYWFDGDGVMRCLYGKDEITDLNRMSRLWTYCAKHPILHRDYKRWVDGGGWADVDEEVAAQVARGSNVVDVDPAELLADQVKSALAEVNKYQLVDSDEIAAKAQSMRARLLELVGQGTKAHKEEKAPHLAAGQAVDRKWNPTIKEAQSGADLIRRSLSAWETLKADEARRRHEEEVAAAQDHALPEPEAPELDRQVRGGYGKAASVRSKWVVAEVTDWQALFDFYKHRDEVQMVLMKLANADVVRSRDIPGIRAEEIRDVR